MKLTIKVTNVFFSVIAIISLFMPIAGYSTLLTGESYNLVDLIKFVREIDPNADTSLLSNLGESGYRGVAIAVVVFFALMLVCLLVTTVLGFMNVPYLARTISAGLGFASYLTAALLFLKIGNAFVAGTIPTSAITSLVATEDANILTSLLTSFVSITKMGLAAGAFVGITCLGILFLVNLFSFIFRKKIAQADGEDINTSKKTKKVKKAKKSKKQEK